ncbi:MAG: sugar transferase [Eubacterium sp.]|nr:sugar transferase [Eubacterium sp.]
MALDVLTAALVYYVVCRIRMRVMNWNYAPVYRTTQIVVIMLALFVVFLLPLHKNILKRGPLHELAESFKYISILAVGIMLYHFLTKRGALFSRGIFLMFWIAGILAVWLVRSIYKILVKKLFLQRAELSNLVLVTGSSHVQDNYLRLEKYGKNRYQIGAVLILDTGDSEPAPQSDPLRAEQNTVPEEDEPADAVPPEKLLHSRDELDTYTINNPVDEVFIDLDDPKVEKELAKDLITMGITVHIALTKQFKGLPNQEIETVGGRSVMTSAVQSVSATKLMIKRLMDIAGALVGLILTGIAFVIFAPIIYHQSKGPIFYEQIRVGLNGRRFRIYKFRSMYPDADKRKKELLKQNKMKGHMFKVDNDPRILPIGRFMRKYSIDELPQFWNVLKGDMSLVGTRPPTVDEWKLYSPHHRARLSVKPGLTGMWQVSGRSDIVDFEKVVQLDMKYIREWSLKLDCKLLVKTVEVVVRGRGAE